MCSKVEEVSVRCLAREGAESLTWVQPVCALVSFRQGADAEVLFGAVGNAKLVTLNRPRALNALSMTMVREMHPQLDAWCAVTDSPTSTAVLTTASGDKAFCGE